MRRRTVLTTGVGLASGVIAGCLGLGGGGDEDPESTPTSEPDEDDDQTTESSETTGELSLSAEPSATEIEWGDEYSIEVTVQAGDEPTQTATVVIYQTEGDSSWSGAFDNSEMIWQLDAGETGTETFETKPPSTGALTVALMNVETEEVVEEWELTVLPPTAAFGETISYYDGLDLTLDAEIHEWMDFKINWFGSDESVVRPITPKNGKWVKVNVVAENTNTNEEVHLPDYDKFSGLGGNSQLNKLRELGAEVGSGTNYIVDDERNDSEKANLRMHYDGVVQQDGYWYPPSDLVSGAVEEGWFVFATAEEDITVDDLEIRVNRAEIDARATWTNE